MNRCGVVHAVLVQQLHVPRGAAKVLWVIYLHDRPIGLDELTRLTGQTRDTVHTYMWRLRTSLKRRLIGRHPGATNAMYELSPELREEVRDLLERAHRDLGAALGVDEA